MLRTKQHKESEAMGAAILDQLRDEVSRSEETYRAIAERADSYSGTLYKFVHKPGNWAGFDYVCRVAEALGYEVVLRKKEMTTIEAIKYAKGTRRVKR